jgi:hypothetical protein
VSRRIATQGRGDLRRPFQNLRMNALECCRRHALPRPRNTQRAGQRTHDAEHGTGDRRGLRIPLADRYRGQPLADLDELGRTGGVEGEEHLATRVTVEWEPIPFGRRRSNGARRLHPVQANPMITITDVKGGRLACGLRQPAQGGDHHIGQAKRALVQVGETERLGTEMISAVCEAAQIAVGLQGVGEPQDGALVQARARGPLPSRKAASSDNTRLTAPTPRSGWPLLAARITGTLSRVKC